MDRLKSIVTRARSLRVSGSNSNSTDNDTHDIQAERRQSEFLTVPLRSSSSSRQKRENINIDRAVQDHVTFNEVYDTGFAQEWEPSVGQEQSSHKRDVIYVTDDSPVEPRGNLANESAMARRSNLLRNHPQPEATPHFQLAEKDMFPYEDANPCNVCKELTVDKILSSSKDYLIIGCKHQESGKALQQAADEGCKLCQMMAEALLLGIAFQGQGNHMSQWITSKWSTAVVHLKPSPRREPFYGPVTVEINAVDARVSSYRLGLYTDRGDPAADYLPGRRLSRRADLETICYEVKRWMKHDMGNENPITTLPRRLIDVRHDKLKLRQADDFPYETDGPYICLSHRWGAASQLITTTLATLDNRIQGISFDDLSQTFKDAVLITRKLGISYIWIDSLCIIQDSREDWEEESGKMGTYYGSSWLTIGAGMDGDGLFLERLAPPKPYCRLRMPVTEDSAGVSNVFFTMTPHDMPLRGIDAPSQSPLYSRGWTLQEEMLSPRFLSFEPTQVYYRGSIDVEYESGYRSIVNKWKGFGQQHLKSRDLWVRIVEDFTSRTLSVASDKLPALSGLAHEYQNMWKDTYLAGLWHSELWKQLLWSSNSPQRPARYRAPTWSWASIDGPINFAGTRFSESCITVIGALVEPKGKNVLGQVKGGILTIRATVIESKLRRDYDSGNMQTIYLLDGDVSYKLEVDEAVPAAVDKVFSVYVTETMGLILLPMQTAEATFKRIGLWTSMKTIDRTIPKSIISIV